MYSTLGRKYRRIQRELTAGTIALIGIFFTGTLWYRFVERWSWEDSIYMTVITLSTVGFSETQPLGQRGRS